MRNRGTAKNYTFMLLMIFVFVGVLFYNQQITKQIDDIVKNAVAPEKTEPAAMSVQKRRPHSSPPVINPANDPLAPRAQAEHQKQDQDPRSRIMERLKPAENFPPAPSNPLKLEG